MSRPAAPKSSSRRAGSRRASASGKDALRRRLLREWRGIEEPWEPPDRTVSAGEVLAAILPKLGLADQVEEQQIAGAWKREVGDFLAGHSAPVALRDGCLSVRVAQPTVRYELEQVWSAKILAGLQRRFGKSKIRSLRFLL